MSMIGRTLGHYQITSQLGKGGRGEVFRAKDQKLGREIAIKVLPEEFGRDTEETNLSNSPTLLHSRASFQEPLHTCRRNRHVERLSTKGPILGHSGAFCVLTEEMTINQKEKNHGKPIFAED